MEINKEANSYLGAARNDAAEIASGDVLLFMDDDNIAKPNMLEVFIKAYLNSRANILTCFSQLFKDGENPAEIERFWLPLGGALGSGIFINAYGDANALIEKRVFEDLGGFTIDYGVGYEDWEFFTKAVLRGYRLEVIPEPLYYYRISKESMMHKVDRKLSEFRRLRPYLFMDDKGLGVGIGYAVKLYLENINSNRGVISDDPEQEISIDSDYYKLKFYAKKFWSKKWFRISAKYGFKCLQFLEKIKIIK